MDDREVEARLHAALGDGLSGHVDVITLIDGARAGAVRVRRRRRVAAGAALLVALAVPAGAAVWSQQDQGPEGMRVAASPPDAPSASVVPDPTQAETASAPPAPEVDPSTLGPEENAVEIPLEVLPTANELPVPMVRLDASAYRLSPVVMGQMCNLGRDGTEPIAGVADSWAEENSNAGQLGVSTNVTAYSRGQGATAFSEARTGTGSCQWLGPAETTDFTSETGPGFTRVVSSGAPVEATQTVVMVGDLLVGVEVTGPGASGLSEVGRDVAAAVARRLVEARVPGSAG